MSNNTQQQYWENRWRNQDTGWDIGYPAPALTQYIDTIVDKHIAILIPGCGNAYEAEYLLQQGFTNVTLIDVAPAVVDMLRLKYKDETGITVLLEDFFEHKGKYDLILEQTFFCAIPIASRIDYVNNVNRLLQDNGRLVGILFNRTFHNPFPPFGGDIMEYRSLFEPSFTIQKLEPCYNSITPRAGSEVFINFLKK